jgi:hypothetical protein
MVPKNNFKKLNDIPKLNNMYFTTRDQKTVFQNTRVCTRGTVGYLHV